MNACQSRNFKILRQTGLGLLSMMATTLLHAESASMTVGASVSPNCTISTANIDFGVYDPMGEHATQDLVATGHLDVACTAGAWASINLGESGSTSQASSGKSGGGQGSRAMQAVATRGDGKASPDGDMTLLYNLYSDAGMTQEWSDTPETSVALMGSGSSSVLMVYGNIPAGQAVNQGSYVDMIVATVTF